MIRKGYYGLWLVFLALSAQGQDNGLSKTVNETFMGKTPQMILNELVADAGLKLNMGEHKLPAKIKSYTFKGETVKEAIEKILNNYGLHYAVQYGVVLVDDQPVDTSRYRTVGNRDFNLSGKVVDEANGEALAFATVGIIGTNYGTTTNADGFFTLLNIPTDTMMLTIHYVGHTTSKVPIVDIIDKKSLIIKLGISEQRLEEVVVSASNLDNQMMSATDKISQISVSPEALSALPSMGEKDIFRSIQLLPGVSGTNEASSGLFVRGGTPDQNLVVLDGFTVYHVDHFYGFFSAFNPNAIKNVQLHKGGFESKYGGRLSSVMELTGKTGNQNKFSGGAGIGAISANAFVEVPIGEKFNLFLAGRRSYTDIITSGIYDDIFDLYNDNESTTTNQNSSLPSRSGRGGGANQQEETEPSFFFYDANAKLSFRPSAKDVISLSYYSGKDDLDNSRVTANSFEDANGDLTSIDTDVTDLLQWGNIGTSLRWARQWNDRFYSNAVTSFSNYFSDRDRINDVTIDRADSVVNRRIGTEEINDLFDYSFAINNEYLLNQFHTIEFGAQTIFNDISYSFVANDTVSVIDEKNKGVQAAFYLQDTWEVNNRLTVIGGLRSTYFDVTDKMYFEPRLSASYSLSKKWKLKAAWGHYYQFVNRIVREDVSQGSRDFWLLSDDQNSPVSFSRHLIGGISYETNGWLFDVEVYDKSLDGIVEYSNRQSATALVDLEDTDYFFEGTGVARGIEWLIQKKTGKYKGWVSYTIGEVVHDIPGISDNPFYALHDTRHEINLVNTYEVGRWEFGATWVYGTGKPYTSPYGEYELTTLDGVTYNYISVGAKNSFRLPNYHRMDLSANYKFKMGETGSGQIGLSLFNLYNRDNTWYKEFLVEEEEVLETDVNLIGFTPNLNLSFKF
ncbi:MAG: TonB-dependent receptor [Reichenbachiella sp.]|uniref:TonB-dependent receptor n=3 Tax=Reichenbachiella sp. TaxID=2184521 RepID=UPI0032996485